MAWKLRLASGDSMTWRVMSWPEPRISERTEQVLDQWAAGRTMGQIALALRLTRNGVSGRIGAARERGDPRAARRGDAMPEAVKARISRSKRMKESVA